jgi:hypothetical protein
VQHLHAGLVPCRVCSALAQIAEALNARGVQTARGGAWYASSVRNLLLRADA